MDSKPVVLRPYQREVLAKLRSETRSRVFTILSTGFGKMGLSDGSVTVDAPQRCEPRGHKSEP
jgi:hypothetical protein